MDLSITYENLIIFLALFILVVLSVNVLSRLLIGILHFYQKPKGKILFAKGKNIPQIDLNLTSR